MMILPRVGIAVLVVGLLATLAPAQFPDMIYYKFDEGAGTTTQNLANAPVGSLFANVTGHTLAPAGGQFGGGLLGSGGSSTTDYVDTGWNTNLTGSFTVGFWLDLSTVAAVNPFAYVMGDSTAGSFRSFVNGAAGLQGIILRGGGMTDVTIPGGANQAGPQAVAWVYDATVPEVRAYLNGALVNTVAQPALNIVGTAPLKVAGYSGSGSLPLAGVMDEFRLYSYALTSGEISATWNATLFDQNILTAAQTGPGIGDLNVSLTNISPTATEGYTLISATTGLPPGAGPFFGIFPDAGTFGLLFTTPLQDGSLFHFPVPSPTGAWPNIPWFLPPGSVSFLNGLSLDLVVVLFQTGTVYDSKSNVERILFQ